MGTANPVYSSDFHIPRIPVSRIATLRRRTRVIRNKIEKYERRVLIGVGICFLISHSPILVKYDDFQHLIHDYLHPAALVLAALYVLFQLVVEPLVSFVHKLYFDRDFRTRFSWLRHLMGRSTKVKATWKVSSFFVPIESSEDLREAFVDFVATTAFNQFPKAMSLERRREYFRSFHNKNWRSLYLIAVRSKPTDAMTFIGYVSTLPLHVNTARNHLDGVTSQYDFTGYDILALSERPTFVYLQAIVTFPQYCNEVYYGPLYRFLRQHLLHVNALPLGSDDELTLYAEEHTYTGQRMLRELFTFERNDRKSKGGAPMWYWSSVMRIAECDKILKSHGKPSELSDHEKERIRMCRLLEIR